ncbi:uncharacterized protein V1518DRAFT_417242 [Limtongia smithiae]|uniref:uncharacterized protein n=1 Tax=Limtongia smithiae TaxID=1125753 RepID=UPI0034CD03FE
MVQIRTSSRLRELYLRWKGWRKVPFRTKFFIGMDLEGNTFWEFENRNNPGRPRRIVELLGPKKAYIDYKLPPQWNQWLRHVRIDPPSIEELDGEQSRLAGLAAKVAAADARWRSVPLKDSPVANNSVSPQGMPGMDSIDANAATAAAGTEAPPSSEQSTKPEAPKSKSAPTASSPSADYQPTPWSSKPRVRK